MKPRVFSYPTAAALLCTAVLFGAAELGYIPGVRGTRVAAQERAWRAAGVRAYEITVMRSCLCYGSGVPVRVVVRNGRMVSAHPANPIADADSLFPDVQPETIEDLFRVLHEAAGTPGTMLRARYDPVLHYPREVHINASIGVADAETDYEVAGFRRLDAAPGSASTRR
jgi:hypothetical protein